MGVVRDPSVAPVGGVKILAQNLDTNQQHRAVTNDEGYYEYPLLPAGRYNLEAESAGFERVRIQAFDLATGTRPRIDISLKIGTIAESVEVQATSPMINTTTTDLGVVMPRQRIDELPLNGRNFQDLVELQAGVVNAP